MYLNFSTPHKFTPEHTSRRGEVTAWILMILVVVTWIILWFYQQNLSIFLIVLAGFLLFIAAGVSLSNWMDRQTVICLDIDGITFRNGLRNVRLAWDEIRSVKVSPLNGAQSVCKFWVLAPISNTSPSGW